MVSEGPNGALLESVAAHLVEASHDCDVRSAMSAVRSGALVSHHVPQLIQSGLVGSFVGRQLGIDESEQLLFGR